MTQIAIAVEQETKKLFPLTNDAMMKLYFTREENMEQLKQFIKATTHLTNEDLFKVEIKNPYLSKQQVLEKDFIVDIRVTSTTGHQINIEVQVKKHADFIERMVSYNARQYSTQLHRGDEYSELKEAISIIVVDFSLFDDTNEFFEHILFRRKNGKVFTNAQQFYIIDLTKMPFELTGPKHQWGALFKAKSKEELEMLIQESDEMKVAAEKLMKLNEDKIAREIAIAREESQWAWEFTKNAERRQAHAQGRKEAEAQALAEKLEEKLEIARKLLSLNLPIEQVVTATNLTLEAVEALQLESS